MRSCIETVVYRDLNWTTDLPRVMTECGLLIGGVLLIQGVALGFTNYLVDAEIMTRAADWATGTIHSRWVFLLALNLFLLIVGCLMEIYAAIVIQAPLLVTIGHAFGIDPVHLGIIFLGQPRTWLSDAAGGAEPPVVVLPLQEIRPGSLAGCDSADARDVYRCFADHLCSGAHDDSAAMVWKMNLAVISISL